MRRGRSFGAWTAAAVAFVVCLSVTAAASAEADHVLKVATLAPEESSWAKAFQRMSRELEQETDGEVEIKLFAGGVMGDEPAMVRKMRTGQLDGAALTNTGLGEIEPKVLALQLPLLFKNWEEVDYVREQMSGTFESMLAEEGFRHLTWGDVGFNYLFSKKSVREPSDIQGTKMWVWESDPIMKEVMEVGDVNAVPLEVTDVLPSLSTGVVDAFTNSPYGAVSLQWYTQADYVTNLKLGVIVGGIVMRSESLEKLSKEHREALEEIADKHGEKMLTQIRKDNKKAIGTIQSTGVEVVEPKNMSEWREIAEETRQNLAGDLFPASLLETIEQHLKDYRSK